MAMSQRWVSPPPGPTDSDVVSEFFGLFYDRNGPREAFKREWRQMTAEQRQLIRLKMEGVQERMKINLRAMPPQLLLVFRYFELSREQ